MESRTPSRRHTSDDTAPDAEGASAPGVDIPEAIAVIDSDGIILDVNARWSEVFGETVGAHIDEVTLAQDHGQTGSIGDQCEGASVRVRRSRGDGPPVLFAVSRSRVDIGGRTVWLAIAHEISEPSTKPAGSGLGGECRPRGLGRAAPGGLRFGAPGADDRDAGRRATFDRALDGLWAAFQPIVTRDGTVYGHEALMRSNHAALPGPCDVLDAAERLGELPRVVSRMARLGAAGVADPACGTLFFNLHPRDLYDDRILADDFPLRPLAERVMLEITERASIEKLGDVRSRAAALRSLGYRLALDDLGAGYAGLTVLAAVEPEVAKIDMGLLRGVDNNATKRKLIGSLAAVCRDLGILTVAEGVETRGELDCLLGLGCDLVQGYLIARPGPAFPLVNWPVRLDREAE